MVITEGNKVLNFKEFICGQRIIWTKYDSLEKGLSLKESEKSFINNLDRYILHTLEEVEEVKMETPHSLEYLEEVVDVIMYTGTIYSIIEENIREFLQYYKPIREELDLDGTSEDYKDDIKVLDNVISTLIKLRLHFKKRKWHKISEEMPYEQKLQTLLHMELTVFKLLMYLFNYLRYIADDKNLGTFIEVKQNFVIMLEGFNN